MEKTKTEKYRPPIVTIMGHVDHGKTTLLDAIRQTNVVAREHGGITQHIGAYQITHQGKPITFIDTPGHAAFEKMRSRGAEAADIVILVVAATEGVKPQTVEAIRHIQKAQKKLIVAFTKCDLPHINIEKVKKELRDAGILVEDYGGDVPTVQVAAPKNQGIDQLLELILLLWELAPEPSLPADPLQAVVVESALDKSRGPVVTVIVKTGRLSVGQKIAVEGETITVRALIDDANRNLKEALPGQPVEILGFKNMMEVGSIVADSNLDATRQPKSPASFSEIIAKSQEAKNKFKVIVKADVLGSLEAILANLPPKVLVLSSSSGEISPSDIDFAKTAHAPIIAFNLKIPPLIQKRAEQEGVFIKNYNVIYELLADIEDVVEGFEHAKQQAKVVGRAKIVATFIIEGQKIAGSKVSSGKISVGDQVLLLRNRAQLGSAKVLSLRKFKKVLQSASAPSECGIALAPNLDFQEGDVIESFGP